MFLLKCVKWVLLVAVIEISTAQQTPNYNTKYDDNWYKVEGRIIDVRKAFKETYFSCWCECRNLCRTTEDCENFSVIKQKKDGILCRLAKRLPFDTVAPHYTDGVLAFPTSFPFAKKTYLGTKDDLAIHLMDTTLKTFQEAKAACEPLHLRLGIYKTEELFERLKEISGQHGDIWVDMTNQKWGDGSLFNSTTVGTTTSNYAFEANPDDGTTYVGYFSKDDQKFKDVKKDDDNNKFLVLCQSNPFGIYVR